MELLEKGRVRFWLQAENMSANGKVDYVFNDNLVSQGEVRKEGRRKQTVACVTDLRVCVCVLWVALFLQKYKMNVDKNTSVVEMIMESLTPADEGTFTFQMQDGKATNQSSLVLIGDGTSSPTLIASTCAVVARCISRI